MAGDPPLEDRAFEYRSRLLTDAVRHQMTLILLAGLLGLLLGGVGSLVRPGRYTSIASVLINPLQGNPYAPGVTGQDGLVSLETEAQVAASDNVSALVAQDLGNGLQAVDLEKHVAVAVPANTQIIEVSYSAGDPGLAHAAAQAYAQEFLEYRAGRARSVSSAQARGLRQQQAAVRRQLAEARAKLQTTSATGSEGGYYRALLKSLNSQLVSVQGQLNALSSVDPHAGHVISPATRPLQRSGIAPPIYLVVGLLLGLGLGVMGALARQRRDDRVYHLDEIEAMGIPLLATLAAGRRAGEHNAEVIRGLREQVLAGLQGRSVVNVAPTGTRAPAASIARPLAQSLANVGRKVVLVDIAGDLSDHLGDGSGAGPTGITDVLMDRSLETPSLLREVEPGLRLLPGGGPDLTVAADFADVDRMLEIIAEAGDLSDCVVINSTAVNESMGMILGRVADLTVLTVALGEVTRTQLLQTRFLGEEGLGRLLGSVLTPRSRRRDMRRRAPRARRGVTEPLRPARAEPGPTGKGVSAEDVPA